MTDSESSKSTWSTFTCNSSCTCLTPRFFGLVLQTLAKWSFPIHFLQVWPLARHFGSPPRCPLDPQLLQCFSCLFPLLFCLPFGLPGFLWTLFGSSVSCLLTLRSDALPSHTVLGVLTCKWGLAVTFLLIICTLQSLTYICTGQGLLSGCQSFHQN